MNTNLSNAKPMQCPICSARLCDIMPLPTMSIKLSPNKQGVLILKCYRCRNPIGIEIEFNNQINS